MYVVTAYPNYRLRARSHQAGRAAEVEICAQTAAGEPGRGLLRRGQSRRHGRSTASTSSTRSTDRPLRSTSRPGRPSGARSSATSITARPSRWRRPWPTAASTSAIPAARWACAAGSPRWMRDTGKLLLAGLQHRPRQRRADRPGFQAVLRLRSAARISASAAGRRRRGRSAAAMCGAGSRTMRNWMRSITAPAIPDRGMPISGPGDNKWTAGIFARDPATGAARWYYQYLAARRARLRRHQRADPARHAVRRQDAARCWSTSIATATSM